jgi:hypothetical protein
MLCRSRDIRNIHPSAQSDVLMSALRRGHFTLSAGQLTGKLCDQTLSVSNYLIGGYTGVRYLSPIGSYASPKSLWI